MLINQSFEIPSCDDAELNIKRTSKLEYRISYDDTKEMKALVFVIGGYGANANISFLDFDRQYLAKNFPVVAINVFYHCFSHRNSTEPKYSASISFSEQDLLTLAKALEELKLDTQGLNSANALSYYAALNERIISLKIAGKLSPDYQAKFNSTFNPAKEEYQNFGLMPTLDHINALKHLVQIYPEFKTLPKLTGGGSYGGYLALLTAKIAPWYIDGVIENSASALPSLEFIIGQDLNKPEYYFSDEHKLVGMFVKTHWTANASSPYFFSKAHYKIRSLLNATHLSLQARANPHTIFASYHSAKDPFDTAKDKQILFSALKELGFDARLNLIENESQIDGKFIKNLNHGMRINDRALFAKELPSMLEKLQERKFTMKENSITYPCEDKLFIFADEKDKFKLHIKEKNGNH